MGGNVKKLLIFSLIFNFLILTSCSINGNSVSENQSKEILNIYQETSFDYIVTGLDEKNYSYVENLSSINQYAEFYNVAGVTNTNKGEADIYVRSLKDNSKLYLTEYTDSRVIHKIEDTNDAIYIFESFSNSYDIKIGNVNIVCLFFSITMILLITYSLVENKNNFIGVLKFNYLSLLIVFGFIFISFILNMLFVNAPFSNTLKSKNIKK